jgi:hypothetical protein
MAVWNEPAFVGDLRALLAHARADVGQSPPPDVPYMTSFKRDGPSVFLQGDAVTLLRSLQRRLAGSATADLGPSLKDAQELLLLACGRFIEGSTVDEVASWLSQELEKPIDDWIVAEPVSLYIPTPRLVVGACTLAVRIPQRLFRKSKGSLIDITEFNEPLIYTRVRARDRHSAYLLASEHIAEATAILDVLDRPKRDEPATAMFKRRDGAESYTRHRQGWILDQRYVVEPGRLIAPYHQAGLAAARPEDHRSDWERRVLAAMRWFSLGVRSTWTAQRLACLISALECLFVQGQKEERKANRIARGVTDLFIRRDMTADEQRAWLKRLYAGRNSALHEGRHYANDLTVDQLADLVHVSVRWAAHHLDPGHRTPRRSCRTFEEVKECTPR